ncbi:MAG: Lhr-like helicase [Verrucomicrobiales bacterium]|jgi:Lhr-like helicase
MASRWGRSRKGSSEGDHFIFAGRRLELVRFRDLTATVKLATKPKKGKVAIWGGNRFPLSTELAESVAQKMREGGDFESAMPDLLECMNIHELARRQFREVARVAGLVLGGYPGKQKSNRSLQVSSGLIYEVFTKCDRDNLLVAQAQREILERQLEIGRLQKTLDALQKKQLVQIATARL